MYEEMEEIFRHKIEVSFSVKLMVLGFFLPEGHRLFMNELCFNAPTLGPVSENGLCEKSDLICCHLSVFDFTKQVRHNSDSLTGVT